MKSTITLRYEGVGGGVRSDEVGRVGRSRRVNVDKGERDSGCESIRREIVYYKAIAKQLYRDRREFA
jgi:hypothetical protein